MQTMQQARATQSGGILVVALIAMTVLALIATAALDQVGNRHAVSFHSQSWNEALTSAEVGADVALGAMNDSISNPSTAWVDWSPADATTFPKTWTPTLPPHLGEGNVKVHAQVVVDNAITDVSGEKWLRIRSTGVTELVGTGRSGLEPAVLDVNGLKNHRSVLRKARFSTDVTSGALHLPQVARTVEVMAGSVRTRLLSRALAVQNAITMSGGASIDSFDPTDPTKSTSGAYDVTKRQDHADVATNSIGSLSDLNSNEVRGSAFCNGGSIQDASGVIGPLFDNFSTSIPPVTTPVWGVINVTPSTIDNPAGGMTLVGGPSGSPQNYKVSKLDIKNVSNPLILVPHTPGQESYVNIWVTGTTKVTATGYIEQQPGVHVTIYSEGAINFSGGGIRNQTGLAKNLQVFGVNPAAGATSTMTVAASQPFIGVINAPAFDITMSGSSDFIGAALGRSATLNGTGYHYDESLADLTIGPPTRYEVASWLEDVR